MNLKAFFKAKGAPSQVEFAAACGISESFLSRLINAERAPSISLIRTIETKTSGKVRFADWPG